VPLSELELNFSKVFPKDLLEVLDERQVLDLQMKSTGKTTTSNPKQIGNALFPANMFLEGFDQHSRWFLSSMVLSMALTD
jgi:isoleucyl-tRNA synthetase